MSSLRLEGFGGSGRGHRSLVIGKESEWLSRIHSLESESLYKGRSILVIHESMRGGSASAAPMLLRKRWDLVVRMRDSFDAQMLATYVQNAPKPVRILWTCSGPVQEIPRALTARWVGTDVSLVGGTSGELLGCEWETIYFPLQNTPQFTEKVLGMRGSGIKTLVPPVAVHMGEIAENGAALVWSNIDEADARGSLYWYDPKEDVSKMDRISKADAVNMLEDVVQLLKH